MAISAKAEPSRKPTAAIRLESSYVGKFGHVLKFKALISFQTVEVLPSWRLVLELISYVMPVS